MTAIVLQTDCFWEVADPKFQVVQTQVQQAIDDWLSEGRRLLDPSKLRKLIELQSHYLTGSSAAVGRFDTNVELSLHNVMPIEHRLDEIVAIALTTPKTLANYEECNAAVYERDIRWKIDLVSESLGVFRTNLETHLKVAISVLDTWHRAAAAHRALASYPDDLARLEASFAAPSMASSSDWTSLPKDLMDRIEAANTLLEHVGILAVSGDDRALSVLSRETDNPVVRSVLEAHTIDPRASIIDRGEQRRERCRAGIKLAGWMVKRHTALPELSGARSSSPLSAEESVRVFSGMQSLAGS